MIDIYITFDRYERGEDFTIYHFCRNEEEAYQHCFEEDLANSVKFNRSYDFYTFRLQKVSLTRKEFRKFKKRLDTKPADFLERMRLRTMLEKIYNCEEYETEILFSANTRQMSDDVIEYYLGENPYPKDFPSFEEYETACNEYDNRFSEIANSDKLFAEILDKYIKEEYTK